MKLSITAKLLLGFLGLLVLALGVLGTLATFWFVAQESQALDRFLESEAHGVANRLEGIVEGISLDQSLGNSHLVATFQRELQNYLAQRLNRPSLYKTTLAIFDDHGVLLARSNEALDLRGPGPALGPGERRIEDVLYPGLRYRMISAAYALGPGVFGTFRVACLAASVQEPLWSFLTSLLVVLGGCLVVLSLLGVGLLRLTLAPVRSMAQAASQISEQNLDARIPSPPGRDDLARLAATLNGLLARLEADHAFQERLVTELTHQLKTPLTILRGRNEMGLSTLGSHDEWKALVEDNLADIDTLGNLLNTLLALARLDSRIDRVNTVPVDVKATVDQLAEELEPLWAAKDLTFRAEGPPVTVDADQEAFRQILMNLYDNSWKFSPPETVVATQWKVEGDHLVLVVTNQGPPIPSEDLEAVFRRFYRSPAVDGEPGSGLGLSIVRSWVLLHGGSIRAYNPPSGGVAFEIRWPYPSRR